MKKKFLFFMSVIAMTLSLNTMVKAEITGSETLSKDAPSINVEVDYVLHGYSDNHVASDDNLYFANKDNYTYSKSIYKIEIPKDGNYVFSINEEHGKRLDMVFYDESFDIVKVNQTDNFSISVRNDKYKKYVNLKKGIYYVKFGKDHGDNEYTYDFSIKYYSNANVEYLGSLIGDASEIDTEKEYDFSHDEKSLADNGGLCLKTSGFVKFSVDKAGKYDIKYNTYANTPRGYMNSITVYNSEYKKIYENMEDMLSNTNRISLSVGTYYLKLDTRIPSEEDMFSVGKLKISYVNTKKPALNKNTVTISKAKTYNLKLKNAPKGKITWVSGKDSVAVVDKNGKVTAKKSGVAVIFAIIDNNVYQCKVTVR